MHSRQSQPDQWLDRALWLNADFANFNLSRQAKHWHDVTMAL
jgi:hypothetical protein